MKKHEVIHFYKSGGYNHLVDVSVDDNLFAAVTFTKDEMEQIIKKYPLAKDNLFALVDGVEIKLKDLTQMNKHQVAMVFHKCVICGKADAVLENDAGTH